MIDDATPAETPAATKPAKVSNHSPAVTLRLPKPMVQKLEKMARAECVSMADVVRNIIRIHFVKDEELNAITRTCAHLSDRIGMVENSFAILLKTMIESNGAKDPAPAPEPAPSDAFVPTAHETNQPKQENDRSDSAVSPGGDGGGQGAAS